MKTFELRRTYRGREITARVTVLDGGVQILLSGGDRPHIGAVGILDPEGRLTVTQFPGHREGVLCERWLGALADSGAVPAVITTGVHYDNAAKDDIQEILKTTDLLLKEVLEKLIQE